jgi:lipopolysaccharide/colanic/teichoic acid biosynthesis glycosyltransferase
VDTRAFHEPRPTAGTPPIGSSVSHGPAAGHAEPCRIYQRLFDVVVTLLALAPSIPILLIAAGLIRLTSPGPALYRQVRIGKGEKPFTMFKLRTMYMGADDAMQREVNRRELLGLEMPHDGIFKIEAPGVTPVGRRLRRYSIDELPQLFNVLRGEMSIVGPRPSLPWEVELYTPLQRTRHRCRPGITGLWQVSGRNRRSMPEMLALDVAYVESRSFLKDLWILLHTPAAVISAISSAERAADDSD